jgi:endonuclease/exonuclease/phosphatase family metal-dependent hydrolase
MAKKLNIAHRILVTITILVALLAFTGGLAKYISPRVSVIFPFAALPMLSSITLNLLLLIYWSIRRKYWALLPLGVILFNFSYIGGVVQLRFSKPDLLPGHKSFKIATYNVKEFGREDQAAASWQIAEFMNREQVDVICFQEYQDYEHFNMDSMKMSFRNWPYNAILADTLDLLRLAVFSKFPVEKGELIKYKDSGNCMMWCDVVVNNTRLRVFNVHLQTTGLSWKRREIEQEFQSEQSTMEKKKKVFKETFDLLVDGIHKRIVQADNLHRLVEESPYPVLVCGDLNSPPSVYTYFKINEGLKDGFRTAGHGYAYTFRFYKHMLRLDYIFHSESLQGIDYYSPELDVCSDHNPVIMQLGVPQQ